MTSTFFETIKNRRTYYAIGSDSPVSDDKIKEIVGNAVNLVPSAFNSQSARAVVLLGRRPPEAVEHHPGNPAQARPH